MVNMSDTISLSLPPELSARLERLAQATQRPKSYYVQKALEENLGDLEWAYDIAALAESARDGVAETRPLDELTVELGFDPAELRAEARSGTSD